MNKEIRNQRLGEHIAIGIEHETIEDMLFIFDDYGYITATDKMAWNYNKDQDTWTDEQGDTMQVRWGDGILVGLHDKYLTYKPVGDIKIYGSEFGTSGIHEISTVSMKTEKPDTPDIDTIEEVNNPEQG